MTLLLEKQGADVVITEEVVQAAAGNRGNGKEVMTLLLEKRGADVQGSGGELVQWERGDDAHEPLDSGSG